MGEEVEGGGGRVGAGENGVGVGYWVGRKKNKTVAIFTNPNSLAERRGLGTGKANKTQALSGW